MAPAEFRFFHESRGEHFVNVLVAHFEGDRHDSVRSPCICFVQDQLENGFKVEHIAVIPALQIVEEVVEGVLLPPAAHRRANCSCIQDQTVDMVIPDHKNEMSEHIVEKALGVLVPPLVTEIMEVV